MDELCAGLAARIGQRAANKAPQRTLIAIAGPPGSGKSTITERVVTILTEMGIETAAVPMDGNHLSREQLDAFANPVEAHKRRGAPWTFNVQAVLRLIDQLCASSRQKERTDIYVPSFDHAVKDPVQDDICIPKGAVIVVLEGIYLLLDEPHWKEIGPRLDFRVLVRVSQDEARRRVARRHLEAGIEPTIERAEQRFDDNDALNAKLILGKVAACDLVVDNLPCLDAGRKMTWADDSAPSPSLTEVRNAG